MTSISILAGKNHTEAALAQLLVEVEPALPRLIIIVGAVSDLWLVHLFDLVFFGVVFDGF